MTTAGEDGGLDWANASETCIHCGRADYEIEFGPRTLLICHSCQARGGHIECEERHRKVRLEEQQVQEQLWFCSEDCKKVQDQIEGLFGHKLPLSGNLSLQFVRHASNNRAATAAADSALRLLKSSFDLSDLDGGSDLLHRVCTSASSTGNEEAGNYDYSAFLLVLLKQGATLVCAATLRIWGRRFAEIPFVVTRDGYRRCGHFKRLMQALENMLNAMGVGHVVVPCISDVLQMWTQKLGFSPASGSETEALEDQIVLMDPATSFLLKKRLSRKSSISKEAEQNGKLRSETAKAPRKDFMQPQAGSAARKRKGKPEVPAQNVHSLTAKQPRAAFQKARAALKAIQENITSQDDDSCTPRPQGDVQCGIKDAKEREGDPAPSRKRVRLDSLGAARQPKMPAKTGRRAGSGKGPAAGKAARAGGKKHVSAVQNSAATMRGDAVVAALLGDAVDKLASRSVVEKVVSTEVLQWQLKSEREQHAATRAQLAEAQADNAALRLEIERLRTSLIVVSSTHIPPAASCRQPEVDPVAGRAPSAAFGMEHGQAARDGTLPGSLSPKPTSFSGGIGRPLSTPAFEPVLEGQESKQWISCGGERGQAVLEKKCPVPLSVLQAPIRVSGREELPGTQDQRISCPPSDTEIAKLGKEDAAATAVKSSLKETSISASPVTARLTLPGADAAKDSSRDEFEALKMSQAKAGELPEAFRAISRRASSALLSKLPPNRAPPSDFPEFAIPQCLPRPQLVPGDASELATSRLAAQVFGAGCAGTPSSGSSARSEARSNFAAGQGKTPGPCESSVRASASTTDRKMLGAAESFWRSSEQGSACRVSHAREEEVLWSQAGTAGGCSELAHGTAGFHFEEGAGEEEHREQEANDAMDVALQFAWPD